MYEIARGPPPPTIFLLDPGNGCDGTFSEDCRENDGRSILGVVGLEEFVVANPMREPPSSVVILISGTGRLEKRAADDCRDMLGRGVEVSSSPEYRALEDFAELLGG